MNVLFLNFIPILSHVGGVQKVTDVLARELLKRGYKVCFVYYDKRTIPENYIFPCTQYYIDFDKREKARIKKEWLEIVEKNKTDIVVNLHGDAKSLFFIRQLPKSIKVITVNHLRPYGGLPLNRDEIQKYRPKSSKDAFLRVVKFIFPTVMSKVNEFKQTRELGKLIEVSNKYCVLSIKYINRIEKFYPKVDKSKLYVIANPVPYKIERIDYNLKENLILFVGRIVSHKNVSAFIDVWRLLYKNNKEWKAIIVGDGPDLEFLKEKVKGEKLNNIIFEGSREDVIPYYQKAKIVCGTSFSESWNMSLVEGMGFGCVPIAFNSYESISDIIDDKINGFCVEPFNTKQMASDIQGLIDCHSKWLKMSHEALNKSRKFSIETITNEWEKLFVLVENL